MFVRDYALGDMAEGRFAGSRRQKCIGPQFYVRGDGTRAFYFSEVRFHSRGTAPLQQPGDQSLQAWKPGSQT